MGERALWATVLQAIIHDATSTSRHEYENKRDALRWIGTYPSRDFVLVCAMAGVDPEATFDRLRHLTAQDIAAE